MGIGLRARLDLDEQTWQNVVDINLTGVWKTVKATASGMVKRGHGGSIILTSSIAGLIACITARSTRPMPATWAGRAAGGAARAGRRSR